jgi:hypothetical protein
MDTKHNTYMKDIIAQLDKEILQLKNDKTCKKDVNRVISNIMDEYSHTYECRPTMGGFSFRISGGNAFHDGNGMGNYFSTSGGLNFIKDYLNPYYVSPITYTPLIVESLTYNGVDYDGDIDTVIKFMFTNKLLHGEWIDHVFESSTCSSLIYVKKFCEIVRADDIAARITKGVTNKQIIEQVTQRINDNISRYLIILDTSKPANRWNIITETLDLHNTVLNIDIGYDTGCIDDRIEYLEKKKEAALILL